MKKTINYGFVPPQPDERDKVFGAFNSLPKVVRNPSGNWYNYLPLFEKQFGTSWDTYGCTIFGTLNAFETLLKLIEGVEYNFAERYNYNLINLEAPGADPKVAAQSIHEFGVIDQKELPFVDNQKEFKTPRPINDDLKEKGEEWLKKYNFQYEWVYQDESDLKKQRDLIRECLKYSPLGVSVSAWTMNDHMEFDSTMPNNHWCLAFRIDDDGKVWIFDTYEQTVKILSASHDIRYCMRYHLTAYEEEVKRASIVLQILNAVLNLFGLIKKKEQIEEMEFIPIKPMTNKDKFIQVCLDALDKDITPQDLIKDEVACAESISTLLKKVFPDFPIVASTKDLDLKLFMDKRFERVLEGKKGDIIISPRTNTTFGHVGVWITEDRVASNDSKTGKFMGNYSWESWVKTFKEGRGLKIFIYRLKE